mmetsp:Transcript_7259/g.7959  ORF Transcript_7259/g.7959 Transcript_7259/m.7959 type:complete len:524 (-) Transcript_7259:120-1691(-)
MEVLISIDNFEEQNGRYREINSPRTLEACLRSGLDPSELYPRPKTDFKDKSLTKEMLDIKYTTFQNKRLDKIALVRKERNAIISFAEKKNRSKSPSGTRGDSGPIQTLTAAQLREAEAKKAAALLELEEKRLEALKRRQEKEISKIVEKEKTMAALQMKISHAEQEEIRKKKLHEKKVAEEKLAEEKKRQQRELELKKLEEEEQEKRRELARKEAEVEEKLKKKRLQMERQLLKEARQRDEERKQKVEESRKKTEALLKAQEELAEQNRIKMLEREQRILSQLEQKKLMKKEELQRQREHASKRIEEAIEKHHLIHIQKKQEFDERTAAAIQRAKENELLEHEKLKKQSDDRDKKNRLRLTRLIDAYRKRQDHRNEIIEKRQEKDSVFNKIKEERDYRMSMLKFTTDLKLKDKAENVERVARMNEFRRLQILQKIYTEDNKYEDILNQKEEMLKKHAEEAKQSLIRKHEISDTMERMRMSNDFTLLDKLFSSRKNHNKNKMGTGTQKVEIDDQAEDQRLAQTI